MKNKSSNNFEIDLILPPPPSEDSDLKFYGNFRLDKIFKKNGFTLAEILLSLSIIGIVAAIALPSLLGNVHERAFETQKKALYTRFSQSIPLLPSLNGYGQLEGTLSSNSDDGKQHVDTDTAAESFVRDGLSKVMKVANICDSEHLSDCGLPDKIVRLDNSGTVNLSSMTSLLNFNNKFSINLTDVNNVSYQYEQLDTKAAAFETVNGESILVYYNPNCQADLKEDDFIYSQAKMCANFVYDLNGKKGPNTVGKDIGVITALYSTDPVIVAPNPYASGEAASSYSESFEKCKTLGEDARVPNIDELVSMFCNNTLFNMRTINYWSNTGYNSKYWHMNFAYGGKSLKDPASSYYDIRCVKR